jgi:cyclopropane fatty-acyl-phospholipid synthase-like methyltransferase
MVDQNVWDTGKWATVDEVSYDFMTRYIFEKMSSRFSFQKKRILELGCGTGRLSYLALRDGAASVTLVDSSIKAVALARGLFVKESPDSCNVIHSDIYEFATNERYDLVFSSGLIEHFRNDDRYRIVKKHTDLSLADCIIIHPTDTVYSAIFHKLPPAIKLYGFQQSFSDEEMSRYLKRIVRVKNFENIRFHPFYTVPLLHNFEAVNRFLDRLSYGKVFGGLTLTHVKTSG